MQTGFQLLVFAERACEMCPLTMHSDFSSTSGALGKGYDQLKAYKNDPWTRLPSSQPDLDGRELDKANQISSLSGLLLFDC